MCDPGFTSSAFSAPQTQKREEAKGSEAANRLLSMTRDVAQNFTNITKYKRARVQVLD